MNVVMLRPICALYNTIYIVNIQMVRADVVATATVSLVVWYRKSTINFKINSLQNIFEKVK